MFLEVVVNVSGRCSVISHNLRICITRVGSTRARQFGMQNLISCLEREYVRLVGPHESYVRISLERTVREHIADPRANSRPTRKCRAFTGGHKSGMSNKVVARRKPERCAETLRERLEHRRI